MKCEATNAQYSGSAPKFYALRYQDGTEKVVKSDLGKEDLSFDNMAFYANLPGSSFDNKNTA